MNAERLRQHEASKATRARIERQAPPTCRAIATPVVRERPRLPRGAAPKAVRPPGLVDAIEREHQVRVRCIMDAYVAEKERHRATFVATMRECDAREKQDMADCAAYRLELLRDAKGLKV